MQEDEVLDITNLKKVKKIKDKMICNLILATYDENENIEKLTKFLQLTEMTNIENNFPIKI